jgi:hypothetical protein
VKTYITNSTTNAKVPASVEPHILNRQPKALNVTVQLEVTGRLQGPVQDSGVDGLRHEEGADVTTETVRGILGVVGGTHGHHPAGEGPSGDAAAACTAGDGHEGLPVGREAGDVGDVGPVAAEAVGGVEDRGLEDGGFADSV